jgi:hypothetical protein
MATKRKAKQGTAAYFDQKRADHSEWDTKPVKADVSWSGTTVFSIRLPVAELEAMRRYTARLGTNISEFLRTAGAKMMAANPLELPERGEGTRGPRRMSVRIDDGVLTVEKANTA